MINAAIHQLLRDAGVEYRTVQHDVTPTSADSARARGETLAIGAKALLLKVTDEYQLVVLRADRKLSSARLKVELQARRIRFASVNELHELTGLKPGSVPPFGRPLLPYPLLLDESIHAEPRVAFNAGLLTESIIMATEDYLHVAQPERFVTCAE